MQICDEVQYWLTLGNYENGLEGSEQWEENKGTNEVTVRRLDGKVVTDKMSKRDGVSILKGKLNTKEAIEIVVMFGTSWLEQDSYGEWDS